MIRLTKTNDESTENKNNNAFFFFFHSKHDISSHDRIENFFCYLFRCIVHTLPTIH